MSPTHRTKHDLYHCHHSCFCNMRTMHQRFAEHQFQTVYTHHGPEAIIYSIRKPRGHPKAMPEAQFQHFYEVLVKKPPQA